MTKEELEEKAKQYLKDTNAQCWGSYYKWAVELMSGFAFTLLNPEPITPPVECEDLCSEGGDHEWQPGIGTRYCRKCGKGFYRSSGPRA